MTTPDPNRQNTESPKPERSTDPKDAIECCVCRELIRRGARKCLHCDSYQDWRRFMVVSSSVLALLVALVSVTSMSAPIMKETFATRNSDLKLAWQGTTDDHIYLIAANTGTKPGGLGSGTLIITGVLSQPIERSMLVSGYASGETFVAAGASKLVSLSFATQLGYLQPFATSSPGSHVPPTAVQIDYDHVSVSLTMRTIEFKGQIHEYHFTLNHEGDRRFILKSFGFNPDDMGSGQTPAH